MVPDDAMSATPHGPRHSAHGRGRTKLQLSTLHKVGALLALVAIAALVVDATRTSSPYWAPSYHAPSPSTYTGLAFGAGPAAAAVVAARLTPLDAPGGWSIEVPPQPSSAVRVSFLALLRCAGAGEETLDAGARSVTFEANVAGSAFASSWTLHTSPARALEAASAFGTARGQRCLGLMVSQGSTLVAVTPLVPFGLPAPASATTVVTRAAGTTSTTQVACCAHGSLLGLVEVSAHAGVVNPEVVTQLTAALDGHLSMR